MPGTNEENIELQGTYAYITPKKIRFDILPNLYIGNMTNSNFSHYGLDTPFDIARRKKQDWYDNFIHQIEYKFNSRGFRDFEWPHDLSDVIWCLGDSHTLGIGVPEHLTYVRILEQFTGKRVINIGFYSATNIWLSLAAESIFKSCNPKYMIIGWTHLTKRIRPDEIVDNSVQSLILLKKAMDKVRKNNTDTKVIQFSVPNVLNENELQMFQRENYLGTIEQIDYARDGFHIGIDTHRHLANDLSRLLC